jgi:hypothetical protein
MINPDRGAYTVTKAAGILPIWYQRHSRGDEISGVEKLPDGTRFLVTYTVNHDFGAARIRRPILANGELGEVSTSEIHNEDLGRQSSLRVPRTLGLLRRKTHAVRYDTSPMSAW